MSNLYNVTFKIGKRSYSSKFYASSPENILTFANNNLVAKVTKITQIVYEAPDTMTINVDDPSTYRNTLYFTVRNDAAKKSNVIPLQTVKLTRSSDEVFNDMVSFLKLDETTSITSKLAVMSSTI